MTGSFEKEREELKVGGTLKWTERGNFAWIPASWILIHLNGDQ